MKIKIYKENKQFIATISDGWWVARGKTKKEAIKRVIAKYEKELI